MEYFTAGLLWMLSLTCLLKAGMFGGATWRMVLWTALCAGPRPMRFAESESKGMSVDSETHSGMVDNRPTLLLESTIQPCIVHRGWAFRALEARATISSRLQTWLAILAAITGVTCGD